MKRTVSWRRWRDEAPIAVLLAAFACAISLGGWAWRLDRLVYDFGLALWSRPTPPGIVIVAIDDASIEAIGRWPWSRAVHATLLERLAAARPRAIALDLVLSEADADPQQDALLARAMRDAAPVALPVSWQSSGSGSLQTLEPIEPLRSAARLGAAEAAVDADGVLRHAFLRSGPPHAPYPHLALVLMQAAAEAVSARLPTDSGPASALAAAGWHREDRLLIRYAGPPGTIERISYADVLSGAVPAQRLAGRYVLVGMTAQGLGDTLATPVNERHQAMPGIEVLANTLYTLRSGDTIAALGEWPVAALSALLLATLMTTFGLSGARRALPLAVASVPLALLASLLALRAGLWCSPVPYALPALLAYPLWSWRRLERAVAGLDREIARLATDPLVAGAAPPAARAQRGDPIATRLGTLRRAGAMVREARKFYADSLAAMPAAMLVAGDGTRVLLANPGAARLFDVDDADDLLGLDLPRLLAEFGSAEPLDWPALLARLEPDGAGIAVEARLGSDRHYVIHAAAVQLEGLRRLIVAIADIEPVKQAEREREEVLAFVSHDLRSPANAIVLLADLDLQGRVQTPHDALLREIRRLAGRTLQMSDDFVRAAEVRTRTLQRVPARLGDLVEEAVTDLRAQALAAEVDLQVTAVDHEAIVEVDRLLVARAIGNLMSNAIKHSPRGGAVELEASLDEGRLRLRVRDHGPGLTPQQLERLARGDEGTGVQDYRGVGLGLLFVQRVARRHGGELRAALPESGAGTRFELDIPA